MDEKHVERLRALLVDMDQFEGARATSTVLGDYRRRLRAILQDAVTDPQDREFNGGAWDGITFGPNHSLISRLVDHTARGMAVRDGRTLADERDRAYARELVAKVRRLPHPDRADDVVPKAEVNDLPAGSLVVPCWSRDGDIKAEHTVREVQGARGGIAGHDWFRVLYRAPEKPVEVGDVITGKRANDLPDGSIVLKADVMGPVAARTTQYPLTKVYGRYRSHSGDYTPDLLVDHWKFRVLHLGES